MDKTSFLHLSQSSHVLPASPQDHLRDVSSAAAGDGGASGEGESAYEDGAWDGRRSDWTGSELESHHSWEYNMGMSWEYHGNYSPVN